MTTWSRGGRRNLPPPARGGRRHLLFCLPWRAAPSLFSNRLGQRRRQPWRHEHSHHGWSTNGEGPASEGSATGWEKRKKYHMIRWEALCKSKEFRGLGFLDTRIMNLCLLNKWVLKLENGVTNMCFEVLRKKYLSNRGFFFIVMRLVAPNFGKACRNARFGSLSWLLKESIMVGVSKFGMMCG